MKRIVDPIIAKLNENLNLQHKQSSKTYHYNLSDFEIVPNNSKGTSYRWRHKTWRAWLKGSQSLPETIELVNKYIEECRKPYGQRYFNFIHLIED